MMESLRAVLLDAVGTLIEAQPGVYEVYQQAALDECGLDLGVEVFRRRLNNAMRTLLAADQTTSEQGEREFWRSVVRATIPEAGSRADRLFNRLWDHFAQASHWSVYPDVADAWERFQQRGMVVGIASNFDQRLVAISRQLPPLNRTTGVFTSAHLGFRKPHPGFFRRIEVELELPPQACLLIGDQLDTDVLGAVRAGWCAIWIDRSPPTGPRSSAPPPALPDQAIRVGSLTEAACLVSER